MSFIGLSSISIRELRLLAAQYFRIVIPNVALVSSTLVLIIFNDSSILPSDLEYFDITVMKL